jgi:hypothetical protein
VFYLSIFTYILFLKNKSLNEPHTVARAYNWFRKRHIKAFFAEVNSNSLREGALSLMQVNRVVKFINLNYQNH